MDFNVDEFLDQVAPDEPKERDGYLELYQYLDQGDPVVAVGLDKGIVALNNNEVDPILLPSLSYQPIQVVPPTTNYLPKFSPSPVTISIPKQQLHRTILQLFFSLSLPLA